MRDRLERLSTLGDQAARAQLYRLRLRRGAVQVLSRAVLPRSAIQLRDGDGHGSGVMPLIKKEWR